MKAPVVVADGEDSPAPQQKAHLVVFVGVLPALPPSADREDIKARSVPLPDFDDVALLDAVERFGAGLLDLHDFPVNDRDVVDAGGIFAAQDDDKLSPAFRVVESHALNIAMLIPQRRQRQQDALLRPGLLRDQRFHGKPRPVPLHRFSL